MNNVEQFRLLSPGDVVDVIEEDVESPSGHFTKPLDDRVHLWNQSMKTRVATVFSPSKVLSFVAKRRYGLGQRKKLRVML